MASSGKILSEFWLIFYYQELPTNKLPNLVPVLWGGQDAIGVKLKPQPRCQATLRHCADVVDE
ncbi:MAG: hypothetical protein V7L00_22870, partial [Nostoc sp.]|uniref:hypothetical protein n=1 Tax=Nostoc sp. TaxID=1180 RepID=UPI002FFC45D0